MFKLVKIQDGRIYFKTDDKFLASKLGGHAIKGQWDTYRIYMTLHSLLEIHKHMDGADKNTIKEIYSNLRQHLQHITDLKALEDVKGDTRLRPYQRVDVKVIKALGESKLIFNQQRTGKSPTTIVSLMEENIKIAVLVCPASLLYQWADEIEKWSYYTPVVIEGSIKKREKLYEGMKHEIKFSSDGGAGYMTFIISYETLRTDIQKKRFPMKVQFDAIIIDEAHRLRNYQSQQSEALYKLGKQCKMKYMLTGTPTINSADEVFGILKMAYPNTYTSYWEFVNYFFHVTAGQFTMFEVLGIKRKKELQTLIYMLSVQRKRKDIMKWLPDKDYQRITLEFDKNQKVHYRNMQMTFETEHISAINTLSQLTRLKQITMNPAILDLDGKSPKEDYILEFIENNRDSSILVFSTSTKFLHLLSDKLKVKHEMIIGAVSKKKRNEYKNQFQSGEIRLLLLNIKASQEGLTLDEADYCIFADRLYEYELNIQAEDRFIPISKERVKPKTIIDLVIKDSVDEILYDEILVRKGNATKIINNIGGVLKRI